ncbi:hypothetical protein BC831DRAFT_450285 [Entophlyctis helioformis]|nr:hypothetical protein BC831DRAFT_450285 [Entophlyctis helioformis]
MGDFVFAAPGPRPAAAGTQPIPQTEQQPPAQHQQQHEQKHSSHPAPPPVPYEPPSWSKEPSDEYYFEVLKNGAIVDQTPLFKQPFLVVGRLPTCDIGLEHQSVSRYHAIVQFKDDGTVHLYDLGSSHGTYLNKALVPRREYKQLRVGDMIRFGQSTRLYILQGPQPDEQSEPEVDDAELRARVASAAAKRKNAKAAASDSASEPQPSEEVTWGFREDAYDGDEFAGRDVDISKVDRASIDADAYYYADPRKALRVWFEARGYDMEFQTEEEGHGVTRGFMARIELPVDTGMGTVYAVGHSSRKKDAERDAALEACVKLDRLGMLRGGVAEVAGKQKKRLKDIYGDDGDDQDTFYDRTSHRGGKRAGDQGKVENYESLTARRAEVVKEMESLQAQIKTAEQALTSQAADEDDELDQFMSQVKSSIQTESTGALAKQLKDLQAEMDRLDKLIKIAMPSELRLAPGTAAPRAQAPAIAPSTTPAPAAVAASDRKAVSPSKQTVPKLDRPLSPVQKQPDVKVAAAAARDAPKRDRSPEKKQPSEPEPQPEPERVEHQHEQPLPDQGQPRLTKRRRYGVITQDQSAKHDQFEDDDVVDSVMGASSADADAARIAKMNASYGY